MGIKQEITQAAIMSITCPSCKAKPGELCHRIGHGGGLNRIRKVPTHQRRLSTYVSSDLREIIAPLSPREISE